MPRTKAYNTRPATKEDVIDLAILGKQFVKESKNNYLGWDATKVYNSLFDVIERDDFCVIVLEEEEDGVVGMFIALVTPCFFSNLKQAVEIVWYVDPDHRGSRTALKMLSMYEEWADFRDAVCVNLVNLDILNGEKVKKMYERKGYRLVENTFVKEL
jgi:GNAT superfamily N-acetyltransferase